MPTGNSLLLPLSVPDIHSWLSTYCHAYCQHCQKFQLLLPHSLQLMPWNKNMKEDRPLQSWNI
jgi:hypothetical protein